MNWEIVRDAVILSATLLLATWLRSRVNILQRLLVPNALTAGLLSLLIYELADFPRDSLGSIVYHLLNLSFISMSLRSSVSRAKKRDIVANSAAVFLQYGLQIFCGMGITLVLIHFLMPDLPFTFGALLPLGFVLGAGSGYSISSAWVAFPDARILTVFIASLGYIFSCVLGIFLIYYARRRKWFTPASGQRCRANGIIPADIQIPAGFLRSDSAAVDTLGLHFAAVFLVYGITWMLLAALEHILHMFGPAGSDIARSLWGIAFLFASLVALLFRRILGEKRCGTFLDNGTLNRISGTAIDYMLAAAFASIVLHVIARYWLPLFIVTVTGLVLTTFSCLWFCSRIYSKHVFARTITIFGVSTGTLSSALCLLRVIDPEFSLPVANDYMHAMKLNFFLSIPLIFVINLPYQGAQTGRMLPVIITFAVSLFYILACLAVLLYFRKGRIRLRGFWFSGE